MTTERRMTTASNVKIESRADGKKVLTGYGAVFYNPSDAGSEFALRSDIKERIAPTAFDRALREKHDAMGLFNHDSNQILGRVSSGTMRLSVDAVGLRYEIDLPDTQVGRDVQTYVDRGDLKGSSFAFRVQKQSWEKGQEHDVRSLLDLDLLDTGPVTYPAYASTTTGLRSGDCADAVAARDEWRSKQEAEAVAVRLRLMEVAE